MQRYIYIITDSSAHKIGITDSIGGRLGAMQTGNPNLFRLVLYVPIPPDRQAEEIECAVHERFAAKRMRSNGEWFDLTPNDVTDAAIQIMRLIAPATTVEAFVPDTRAAIKLPSSQKLTYSAKELRELLGVSSVTLWRLEKRGILTPLPDLRHKLYPAKMVEKFLSRAAA
jgi:hypothetical protein